MQITTVILAAGMGKRMNCETPKVLHKLLGYEMINYVLDQAAIGNEAVVVVGHGAEEVKKAVGDRAKFALQQEQKGTGHAVMCAKDYLLGKEGYALIVAGDMPLITKETIQKLLDDTIKSGNAATVLTSILDNPQGYGRIIRHNGLVHSIIEHKDASSEQRAIKEVNTSVYCFKISALLGCLDGISTNNSQGEYYLTDCIPMLIKKGEKIGAVVASSEECMGANDLIQLNQCSKIMQMRINSKHMLNGVRIWDMDSTYIGPLVEIGAGAVIYPNNIIEGRCSIGENALLYPGNFIEDASIGSCSKLGPNAHLRPKTIIGKGCRVGNFVELKNVTLDDGAKVGHLAYCGDGIIGKRANISCGVIFSNYDGKKKSKTIIGDDAFIGCNANLVAPVEIGQGAYIAAGSTICSDVPIDALAIARQRQTNKPDWAKKRRED